MFRVCCGIYVFIYIFFYDYDNCVKMNFKIEKVRYLEVIISIVGK